MVYCYLRNGQENDLDILSLAVNAEKYRYMDRLFPEIMKNIDCDVLKSGHRIYQVADEKGKISLWQVGGNVTDKNGFFVPHLYKVRKIGIAGK